MWTSHLTQIQMVNNNKLFSTIVLDDRVVGHSWQRAKLHVRPEVIMSRRLQLPQLGNSSPATPHRYSQPDTLTYSNDPSPRQPATGAVYRPITGSVPRRSGHKRRPPAKLRVLASSSHAAPEVRSSTCSVKFIDNYACSDSELNFNSKYKRLSTSSSDYSIDDCSDSTDYSRHRDVRFTTAEPCVQPRPQRRQQSRRNPNFAPRRCTICRNAGIQSALFESRGEVTEHTKEAHGCWYNLYGDRYIPIDPDQLAEGRARKIARQVE